MDWLSEFVENTCKNRDKSHGYEHMKTVAIVALDILNNELLERDEMFEHYEKLVMITAWLHDVADHKYDKDGSLRQIVINFLDEIYSCELINVIDYVSYSKEKHAIDNGSRINFIEKFGEINAFVRDIVSDADKLQAIGKSGIERCIDYISMSYMKEYHCEIPTELLHKRLIEHCETKLLRLSDEFIRTKTGKQMAKPLHEEILEELRTNYAYG